MSEVMNKSPEHYSRASILLHWLMLLVLFAAYAAIELQEYWPKGSAPRGLMKTGTSCSVYRFSGWSGCASLPGSSGRHRPYWTGLAAPAGSDNPSGPLSLPDRDADRWLADLERRRQIRSLFRSHPSAPHCAERRLGGADGGMARARRHPARKDQPRPAKPGKESALVYIRRSGLRRARGPAFLTGRAFGRLSISGSSRCRRRLASRED